MNIYTPEQSAAMEAAKKSAKYTRQRCTKYQLVTCLNAYFHELLNRLRQEYVDNPTLQFYWNTVNDLDRNNDDFKTAVAALGITDELLDAIFEKIEGVEPEAVHAD